MSVSPFEPARLGPLTVRNRLIKSATFEGRTPDGRVTSELIEFHREIAAGGVGISTVAYCAVSPEGRTDRNALWLRPEIAADLAGLTEAVHAEGALVAAQLGHAGPVANSVSNQAKALGPSRIPAPMGMSLTHRMSVDDIAALLDAYRRAARVAVDAGFDALELHFGHNYLPSSFLSPLLNRRRDGYGGSLANRARLCREIASTVRREVGPGTAVWAKLNLYDGAPGGLQVDEAYDYRPGYLLPLARRLRTAVSLPLILLGGITDRESIDTALAAGFDFVAMGRALLREPDLPQRIADDPAYRSRCTHCNLCMPTIYSGTRCPLRT